MIDSRHYHQWRVFYRRLRAFMGRGLMSQRTKVVVPNKSSSLRDPIFIVGTHRSGTSLLRRVLDSHSNIACPAESYWLSHFSQILNDHLTFDGLWNLGFDRDQALQGLRECASHFHRSYCMAKGKSRWADKTPQYTEHLEALYTLFSPGARFVIIHRHPMDVTFSIWKRGWDFVEPSGDRIADCCRYVAHCGFKQLDWQATHSDDCARIYYDRLVRCPEATLRPLCEDFFNEPWEPDMIRHHEKLHDFGCEDPVVRGTAGFQGSYENWRAWPNRDAEKALELLSPLMDKLGYSIESAFVGLRESCT